MGGRNTGRRGLEGTGNRAQCSPLPSGSLSVVSVTHGHLWSKNISEINNSTIEDPTHPHCLLLTLADAPGSLEADDAPLVVSVRGSEAAEHYVTTPRSFDSLRFTT